MDLAFWGSFEGQQALMYDLSSENLLSLGRSIKADRPLLPENQTFSQWID